MTVGEDSQEKTTRERPPGKNSQKYIGKVLPGKELSGQDSEERTVKTGQPGQDSQDRTARTGQPVPDKHIYYK
jgi:hypothetical protein